MTKREKLDKYYKKKYGVGLDYYEEKWKTQKKACDLCKRPRKSGQRRFALDHSHTTQQPRGILCYFCNRRRVGALTLEWAERIVEYLKKYEDNMPLS